MDEIIRRLRSRSSQSIRALKESLPVKGITEDEEKDPLEGEEETASGVDDTMSPESSDDMPPEEDTEDEATPEEEETEVSPEEIESEHTNPLDNEYAMRFELGQRVALTYSSGKKSNLVGTIEGYDKEGFYRIKWSNNKITSGFTDISLSEVVEAKSADESTCVCGSTKFVTENDDKVCDNCGRVFRGEQAVYESKAYDVRYTYDGDSLSDYESNIIVVADSPEEAIKRAKHEIPEGRFFRVDRTYDSVKAYKSLYPQSNLKILEADDLEFIDKDTISPKKRIIRSEQHPVSTAIKPSIEESIRNAFSKKKLQEYYEEETAEYSMEKLKDQLEGEFWTRLSDLVEDIKDLGYEVVEYNDEYVTIEWEDEEGDEGELQLFIGGTSRTLTIDFKRNRFFANMD